MPCKAHARKGRKHVSQNTAAFHDIICAPGRPIFERMCLPPCLIALIALFVRHARSLDLLDSMLSVGCGSGAAKAQKMQIRLGWFSSSAHTIDGIEI